MKMSAISTPAYLSNSTLDRYTDSSFAIKTQPITCLLIQNITGYTISLKQVWQQAQYEPHIRTGLISDSATSVRPTPNDSPGTNKSRSTSYENVFFVAILNLILHRSLYGS